jgi:hypothetical protein
MTTAAAGVRPMVRSLAYTDNDRYNDNKMLYCTYQFQSGIMNLLQYRRNKLLQLFQSSVIHSI